MKKILCVFLAILTTVIFSGCFGESDSDSDKASELVYQDNMINDNADDDDADDDVKFYETCSTCNGSGKNACTWCNATGYQDIAGTVMLCGTCGGSGQMNCLICV
ncbi:MAG: hypothetical protein IKB73_05240, partial [Ruminococcus sp.]|nr:hypothetical protein [Ruminococcus sp.]